MQWWLIWSTSTARLPRYVLRLSSWRLVSMPNVAKFRDVHECSKGDANEYEPTLIEWRVYSNWRRCMRCTTRRTINNDQHWRTKKDCRQRWRHDETLTDRLLSGIMGRENGAMHHSSHTVKNFTTFFDEKDEAVLLSTSTVPHMEIAYTATYVVDSFPTITHEQIEKMTDAAQGKTSIGSCTKVDRERTCRRPQTMGWCQLHIC